MRLVNVETCRLEEFHGDTPSYAILSHTWGLDHEEISFQDMQQDEPSYRKAGDKLAGLCRQASTDGHSHVWIDTCCIDKSNSVELGEAINSMFRWYKESAICYVYLRDVSAHNGKVDLDQFRSSRWFTRGWTLQELLAPTKLRFYDHEWHPLGEKHELVGAIESITGIPYGILLGFDDLSNASVAQRMSWTARRITKRKEDSAYCLLGIFDVMLPMIYGEEEHAFIRLQEEIIKKTEDDSILAWGMSSGANNNGESQDTNINLFGNALATSPADFMHSGNIVVMENLGSALEGLETARGCLPVRLRLREAETGQTFGFLNCRSKDHSDAVVGIPLFCITPGSASREYIRPAGSKAILRAPPSGADSAPRPIRIRASLPSNKAALSHRKYGFHVEQWSGLLKTDLSIVDTHFEGEWSEERAVFGIVIDIRYDATRRAWLKIRQNTGVTSDFVVALELQIKQMRVQARCHLMVASRDTVLDTIAEAAANSDDFFNERVASNNSLTLEIKLVQDLPTSRLYMVTLAALVSSSQIAEATVDANIELKLLEHTKLLVQLFAENRQVSLELSKFKELLESQKQPHDQSFLALLRKEEGIRIRISVAVQSVQDLTAKSGARQKRWHLSMAHNLSRDLHQNDQPSIDTIPDVEQRTFLQTVVQGHIAAMEYLLAYLITDDTIEDSEGRGALSIAVAGNNIIVLESLLSKGFTLDCLDSSGQSPLARAALLGHDSALLVLLRNGASIDFQTQDGQTPLDVAVRANHTTIVRILLEHGANPRGGFRAEPVLPLTTLNETPLAVAARLGFSDVVGFLLDYGADPNEKGFFVLSDGLTRNEPPEICPALALAAQMGFYDVVSLLLGRKADINATNSIGQTPLLLAAKHGHEQIVQLLLEQGADHKIADKRLGMTPLAAAAANGHSGTVALLLDKGADVDARNKKRETAVFDSIRARSLTTIQLLLNHNANVNAAHSGRTPFFCAIQETNLEAVELLIAHGASTLEKNTLGELPLQYAKRLTNPPNEAARQRRHQILRVLEAHNDYNAVETEKAADLSAAEDGKSVNYGAQEVIEAARDKVRNFASRGVGAIAKMPMFPKRTRNTSTLRGKR